MTRFVVLISAGVSALIIGCSGDESDTPAPTPELTAVVSVANWIGVGAEGADEDGYEVATFEDDGGAGCIGSENTFTVDGSATVDPEGAEGELLFQLCCEKRSFPNSGDVCDNTSFPFGGACSDFAAANQVLSFNSRSRQFRPGDFMFTLNVVKGDLTDSVEVLVRLIETEFEPLGPDEVAPLCSARTEVTEQDTGLDALAPDAGNDASDTEPDTEEDAEEDRGPDVAEPDVPELDAEPDATEPDVEPDAAEPDVEGPDVEGLASVSITFAGMDSFIGGILHVRVPSNDDDSFVLEERLPIESGEFELSVPNVLDTDLFGWFFEWYIDLDENGTCDFGDEPSWSRFESNPFDGGAVSVILSGAEGMEEIDDSICESWEGAP
jgi:hypothetical protein